MIELKEYSIETGHDTEQFIISNINISYEDYRSGNPYNTTFIIKVISGHFAGLSEFEYDIKEFIRFIREIKDLYDFKIKIVELNDICYGSKIVFTVGNTGHVNIAGEIYGVATEHSLTFTFDTDQTAILPFANALHKDFIADNTRL